MTDTSEPVRPDAVRAGAVTLHDVAREAGVSLATASRALNGSTRKVADSYRERVQAAAARLGYTANLSAQATARGTSAIIALLVADIADPYFGEIASGVARGADEEGLVVTVAITERDPAREVRLVRALRGQRPRGLILAASRASKDIAPDLSAELDQFAAVGGRVVALGAGSDGSDVVRGVAIDNRGGAAELGAALAARGYRTAVVLAAAAAGVVTSDDRVAGFADGFGAAGERSAPCCAAALRANPVTTSWPRRSPRASRPAPSSSASATSSRSAHCRCARQAAPWGTMSRSPGSTTSRPVATSPRR